MDRYAQDHRVGSQGSDNAGLSEVRTMICCLLAPAMGTNSAGRGVQGVNLSSAPPRPHTVTTLRSWPQP